MGDGIFYAPLFYYLLAHFTVFFDKICSVKFRVTEGCLTKFLTSMRIYLDLCCYNRPFDYTEWRRQMSFPNDDNSVNVHGIDIAGTLRRGEPEIMFRFESD